MNVRACVNVECKSNGQIYASAVTTFTFVAASHHARTGFKAKITPTPARSTFNGLPEVACTSGAIPRVSLGLQHPSFIHSFMAAVLESGLFEPFSVASSTNSFLGEQISRNHSIFEHRMATPETAHQYAQSCSRSFQNQKFVLEDSEYRQADLVGKPSGAPVSEEAKPKICVWRLKMHVG
jgi:hypothetical protein